MRDIVMKALAFLDIGLIGGGGGMILFGSSFWAGVVMIGLGAGLYVILEAVEESS